MGWESPISTLRGNSIRELNDFRFKTNEKRNDFRSDENKSHFNNRLSSDLGLFSNFKAFAPIKGIFGFMLRCKTQINSPLLF